MIKCGQNGIYGIYIIDDINEKEELIYVGKTKVSFEDRFKSHLSRCWNKKNKQQLWLYGRIRQARRSGLEVELRPLIQLDQVLWNKEYISDHDLSMMEIALIHCLKPCCNYEGVKSPYLFSYERIKDEQFNVSEEC